MKKNLPSVGFDRFIELAWADFALDLAVTRGEGKVLRSWLGTKIDGAESARKTFNVLNNLWLRPFPETETLRAKALALSVEIPQDHRIVLHWGMALANFALFQQTTSIIGKLLRLQGTCHPKAIQQRMAEFNSNQGTIPRAVARIIQSISEWQAITETNDGPYTTSKMVTIKDITLAEWLLEAALNRQKDQLVSLLEVLRLPELFPFEFAENGQKLIRSSSSFNIIREGLDYEYVVVRKDGRY